MRQELLGVDAFEHMRPNQRKPQHGRIQRWIEVWDYSGDAIYRGYVTEHNKERTLFVFFEDRALDRGIRSRYECPCVFPKKVEGFTRFSSVVDSPADICLQLNRPF